MKPWIFLAFVCLVLTNGAPAPGPTSYYSSNSSGYNSYYENYYTSLCGNYIGNATAYEIALTEGRCKAAQGVVSMGPSELTTQCQQLLVQDSSLAPDIPNTFDPTTLDDYRVFDNVSLLTLDAGVVTPPWECLKQSENGCWDSQKGQRGTAFLWAPHSALGKLDTTPRILYLHGGAWEYGSPTTTGYAPFCARIAGYTGYPVLAIDYTLSPVADVAEIMEQIGMAAKYLATHGVKLTAVEGERPKLEVFPTSGKPPPLFLMGDSSGAGSVVGAMVAQARGDSDPNEDGLSGADGARIAAGVALSPWLDLSCTTPTYFTNSYSEVGPHSAPFARNGDVVFRGFPRTVAQEYQIGAASDYTGNGKISLDNYVASPSATPSSVLEYLPPLTLHYGMPELLAGEIKMFAGKAAAAGASVVLEGYDSMWHVFQMYYHGCAPPPRTEEVLLMADVSLRRITAFLKANERYLLGDDRPSFMTPTGSPFAVMHYEYPPGKDSAEGVTMWESVPHVDGGSTPSPANAQSTTANVALLSSSISGWICAVVLGIILVIVLLRNHPRKASRQPAGSSIIRPSSRYSKSTHSRDSYFPTQDDDKNSTPRVSNPGLNDLNAETSLLR